MTPVTARCVIHAQRQISIIILQNLVCNSLLIEVPGVLGEDHEEHDSGGFHVFHVEWERVEVPYAIGLWIIVTALIKVCKS